MENMLLPFAVGLVVGGLLMALVFHIMSQVNLPQWTIADACLQSTTQVKVDVGLPVSTPGTQFVQFHSQVFRSDPGTVPAPGSGSTTQGATTTLLTPNPPGVSSASDVVVVWAEFTVFDVKKLAGTINACSTSTSSQLAPSAATPARSGVVPGHLDAVPKSYRVSAGPAPGPGGGPSAELVGALAKAEVQLAYSSEASTPTEPVWTARDGPEPGISWTLSLLHRRGGFGAVLSVVGSAGGHPVRMSWVTSDWRSHTTNRLTCEADEPGAPAVLVRPA
jgi:hypothetical protein